jgi:hypothetical protein
MSRRAEKNKRHVAEGAILHFRGKNGRSIQRILSPRREDLDNRIHSRNPTAGGMRNSITSGLQRTIQYRYLIGHDRGLPLAIAIGGCDTAWSRNG